MKTKIKIYLLSVIFIIISLALIYFFAYSLFIDIKNSSEKILSDRSRVVTLQKEIKEVDVFKKNYDEYKPNLEKINSLFVDSKNPIEFIKFIEKIASDSSVLVDINLSSSQKGKTTDSNIAVFQVYAKGQFLNILRFAQKLETGPYLTKITNLTAKKTLQDLTNGKGSLSLVEANFLIEVVTK